MREIIVGGPTLAMAALAATAEGVRIGLGVDLIHGDAGRIASIGLDPREGVGGHMMRGPSLDPRISRHTGKPHLHKREIERRSRQQAAVA